MGLNKESQSHKQSLSEPQTLFPGLNMASEPQSKGNNREDEVKESKIGSRGSCDPISKAYKGQKRC